MHRSLVTLAVLGSILLAVPAAEGSTVSNIEGTNGPDRLVGTHRADLIRAFAGDDGAFGREARDELRGGPGRDYLHGGVGADHLYGGSGADRLVGGTGSDVLRGAGGDDDLGASGYRVRLYGGPGADILQASSADDGTDIFRCGRGRDVLVYNADIDKQDEFSGCERIMIMLNATENERATALHGAGRGANWRYPALPAATTQAPRHNP